MPDVIVKKSKIHEKGVFADRDFKKGEVVIKYNLEKLTKEEFENLSEKEKHFTVKEDDSYFLFLSPERYVNHSCEPSTNSVDKCDIAIKDIKKGEEITGDYSKENVPGLNMKCNCGSDNCRGTIT
ncbi:SET domain-containing protein [Patescibacteria group bacterium]